MHAIVGHTLIHVVDDEGINMYVSINMMEILLTVFPLITIIKEEDNNGTTNDPGKLREVATNIGRTI